MKKADLIRLTRKNITRSPGSRVFFAANIIAISVGIVLVVIMLSISSAIYQYSRHLIKEETAALAIEISSDPLSIDTPPLTHEYLESVSRSPEIDKVVPLIQGVFTELSHQGGKKSTISLWSTIGAADPELTRLQLKFGSLKNLADYPGNFIVVPQKIISEIGISPPSRLLNKSITLKFVRRRKGRAELKNFHLTVAAIAVNTRYFRCYAPLPVMRDIQLWQNPETPPTPFIYQSAMVYVKHIDQVNSVRRYLEQKGYRTASILDSVKRYREIAGVITIVLGLIGSISLIAGSVSIFNTTYASVMRRIKEIGIYKTYGATRSTILSLILSEIAVTAITAGAIGFLLGKLVCKVVQDQFLTGSKFNLMQSSWGLFFLVEFLALLVCLLAALWPALKGAKLNPIEAIRHE